MKWPHPFKNRKAKADAEFDKPDPGYQAARERVQQDQERRRGQFEEFRRRFPGSRPTPS